MRQLIVAGCMLFLSCGAFAEDVDSLLSALAKRSDLSEQTKQESVGHLTIFTRQDLERMQIRSLKEFIDYIPYVRYNEDESGQSNPFFIPYQPSTASLLRLYINDREVFNPYFGTSLQIFGKTNLGFIDHIEVYSGVPSYRFGIEGSLTVIKLYTKKPSRENTHLVGALVGSYGTSDVYGYSAQAFDDFSYLLHVNRQDLQRKKFYHDGYALSRNQDNQQLFSQFNVGNHRFEFHGATGTNDNFIGASWRMHPEENYLDYDYISGGWFYTSDDDSLKASLNYTRSYIHKYERSADAKGINPLVPPTLINPGPPPIFSFATYSESELDVDERMSDVHLVKSWDMDTTNVLVGFRGRLKEFMLDSYTLDGVSFPLTSSFTQDTMLSLYGEATQMLSERFMLIGSLKFDKNLRNGGIEDHNILGGRLGAIYNRGDWWVKSFFYWGAVAPEPYLVMRQAAIPFAQPLKEEKSLTLSAEIGYQLGENSLSLTMGHTEYIDKIAYTLTRGYMNLEDPLIFDTASLKYSYSFGAHTFMSNVWISKIGNTIENDVLPDKQLGGHITLLDTFGKWDLSNSLRFYGGGFHPSYNYNLAVTYRHTRQLSFFFKGSNLLDDAQETKYIRVVENPPYTVTTYEAPVYDRTLWFGVEYQF